MKKQAIKLLLLCFVIAAFSIQVAALVPEQVIPMGKTVGIQIQTDGLLVVGFEEDETTLAKTAGLKEGDLITHINGEKVTTTEELRQILDAGFSGDLTMTVQRKGKTAQLCIEKETLETARKLGIYVRDSMAGIGTVTYLDPENNTFGALGHGVEDTETMVLIPLAEGRIVPSQVVDIQVGQRGRPGALKGIFDTNTTIGTITSNTGYGLFGNSDKLQGELMPVDVADNEEIHEGKAVILSNISGDQVEEFDVEITKLFPEESNGRNLLITITDEELLEATGGIVQGMSGSPILQDGKLIGAVTHVLVNDPTRGYGIFIENMLQANQAYSSAA